jgi:hypothetical protein
MLSFDGAGMHKKLLIHKQLRGIMPEPNGGVCRVVLYRFESDFGGLRRPMLGNLYLTGRQGLRLSSLCVCASTPAGRW